MQEVLFIVMFYYRVSVAQLVESLRYKPEFAGSIPNGVIGIRPHYGLVVDSSSNRTEYHELLLGVKAAGA